MNRWVACSIFGILFSFPVLATTFKSTHDEKSMEDFPWMSSAQYQEQKVKAIARGKRGIASAQINGNALMSPEYRKFRDRFLAIKSGAEIDPLLDELDANFEEHPADLKLLAANLIPLRAFRGYVYRLVPVVSRAKVTHSILLTFVQGFNAMQRVYLPTEQWKAGFEYVTQPFSVKDVQFKSVNEVQDYLITRVYSELMRAARRVAALDLSQKPVVWDNQLLYGTASFVDEGQDRYRLVGEAERRANLSAIHATLHNVVVFRAYSADRFFEMMDALGKLWGVSALFWEPVDGATSRARVQVLRKFPENFRLVANGARYMSVAHRHLKHSVYQASLSWNEIKDQPASKTQMMDAGIFRPFTREIGLAMDKWVEVVEARAEVRSAVTGETVVVDLPAIYRQPPASLQSFLPTQFDEASEWSTRNLEDGKRIRFRNYAWGSATGWDQAAYRPYFPDLDSKKNVADAARILSQAWGGGLIGGPLALFVN